MWTCRANPVVAAGDVPGGALPYRPGVRRLEALSGHPGGGHQANQLRAAGAEGVRGTTTGETLRQLLTWWVGLSTGWGFLQSESQSMRDSGATQVAAKLRLGPPYIHSWQLAVWLIVSSGPGSGGPVM